MECLRLNNMVIIIKTDEMIIFIGSSKFIKAEMNLEEIKVITKFAPSGTKGAINRRR